MITVEDLLQAYAYAYDAWLDPEAERKNPIPEYAEFIRRSVSWENAKLRELVDELYPLADYGAMDASELDRAHDLMRELGIEVEHERKQEVDG